MISLLSHLALGVITSLCHRVTSLCFALRCIALNCFVRFGLLCIGCIAVRGDGDALDDSDGDDGHGHGIHILIGSLGHNIHKHRTGATFRISGMAMVVTQAVSHHRHHRWSV